MTKRSRREEFKEAIAAALELQLNEEGRKVIEPFLGYKDMFLEIQRSDWYTDLQPSRPTDPLGIINYRDNLICEKDKAWGLRVTVQATSNGSCILFWGSGEYRSPQDRIDLDEHDPIIVTLMCKLAGISARMEEGVLIQPIANPHWLYHPERMRCARPHLLAMASIASIAERQKMMSRYLGQTYSRWARLKGMDYSEILEGMAAQNEIEANYLDFHRAGRHIYRIEPELIDMLRSSDIDELPYDVLRIPHPGLYLYFGAQDDLLDSLGRPLEGVYVCEGNDQIHFCFVFESVTVEDAMTWIVGQDPFVTVDLHKGATLKEALANGFAATNAHIDQMVELSKSNPKIYEPYSPEWRKAVFDEMNGLRCLRQLELTLEFREKIPDALTLAVNSLLFITTYDDDVATDVPEAAPERARRQIEEGNADQRSRALRKLANDGFVVVNHVGTKLRGSLLEPNGRETTAKRAHWRRGFWRMQRFGKGLSEARLTWVRPTIVSGTNAPAEPRGVIHKVS